MYDWNEAVRSLNVGLPDDIARLKAAGYYQEAIARIDRLLAEDWTKTQNGPASNGIAPPEGYVPPENPTPHGVDALREALTVQKEIMRRLPGEYCWTEAEAIARMQERVKDFTAEEFKKLDWEGRMDWRFVEGEKRYQARFAETLLATHADLAARKLTPDAPNNKNEERHRLHEKMEREGSASADITLRTSIRMSDEAFAAALEKARAEGRDAVHVRAWLALPAACPSQSHITLDRFTETPGHIAAEDAPQRTVCWEADLTENRTFGAEYSYRETAVYADPLSFTPDAEQPDLYTGEEAPHIVFTPYLRALAAQLTEGIASPAEKAKRIYDYVTLNVRYHFQPSYFVHESIAENCARSRRGDCGIMALTFITLCRIAGIPARWESGFAVAPGDAGCHDWARFYVAPKGWMYADCSYGASMARRGDEVLRRHYFGSLDTGRMVANSAFEAPFDPPMLGFRSDPYDNQSGEMEADGVGGLKQVLSGVKTRGILGEIQLGAILEEILAPEQYDTNVATIPGSTQRVEYAIRMPGADGGSVWLPIDSKFPGDTYAHLQDAYASGDAQAVEDARHALELVLRSEARDIREKYVEPPYTTAFRILFQTFEGLYAEVVNAGLLEVLQRDYQVNVAGPSTMAALLNSLQMGFKTLAIQKRSGEVWQLLGAVKTEFDKFGQGLAKMQQRLRQTDEELDQLIGVRSRAISRKLRSVQSLDEASASALLEIDDMNELPKALSETSETSGKVGEY